MTYVAVLPSIYTPYTEACLATCKLGSVLVVDNTEHNWGVAKAWNVGLHTMMESGADWTIIVSAAVRFGADGGRNFAAYLEREQLRWGAITTLGWHLAAVGRPMVERIGYFDENYFAYLEDTDYVYRQWLAAHDDPTINVPTVPAWARLESLNHGIALGGAQVDGEANETYWRRKWGHEIDGNAWNVETTRPFGVCPLDYWPEVTR